MGYCPILAVLYRYLLYSNTIKDKYEQKPRRT